MSEPATEQAKPEQPWPYHCDEHTNAPAWAACTRCGRYLCRNCHTAEPFTQLAICQGCLDRQRRDAQESLAQVAETREKVREALNLEPERVSDFPVTAARVLFSPTRFFTGMSTTSRSLLALLFGLACNFAGTAFALAWTTYNGDVQPLADLQELGMEIPNPLLFVLVVGGLMIGAALDLGLTVLVLLLALRLFRAPVPLVPLTKVVSYAMAARLLLAIPWAGSVLAIAISLVLLVIGLRQVFATATDRALFAVGATILLLGALPFMAG